MVSFLGFSTDSFEQLVRALSMKVFGPGLTPFGNGPDGGREATFNGPVNFPNEASAWNGYGVIQAKYKERLENTAADQDWAEKNLKYELQQWVLKVNRSPKPDYYVFCTNVELTSAIGGGLDRLNRILSSRQKDLDLKGFDIWDANKLSAFIDGQAEIRARFSALLTPGDLIEAFIQRLEPNQHDSENALNSYIVRELLEDEDARLSQAGDHSDIRISLADVFLDLYSSDQQPNIGHPYHGQAEGESSLALLLKATDTKLDPETVAACQQPSIRFPKGESKYVSKYLFIGGPGSGKSTLGQFLAQINRAAILNRRTGKPLLARVKEIAEKIKQRCEQNNLAWPSTPRFPFRVELNDFAKTMACGDVTSLSQYLLRQISRGFSMDHQGLMGLMAKMPCLLILDGLDEVPSSSNRQEVVRSIQIFLNEALNLNSNLLVVASSRPEGYSGEFNDSDVLHRYLVELSPERAIACASLYLNAKFGSEHSERANRTLQTLRIAIEDELVKRIMISPLQVTFMVTVVASGGTPSESRWQLFTQYYETIYNRELQKAVPVFGKILHQRKPEIDLLHMAVGIKLQSLSEKSGGTKAELDFAEFETLVEQYVGGNGVTGAAGNREISLVLDAAKQRLVFLTMRTVGKISFDVRSLQEYMAAGWLTLGDSHDVLENISKISYSSYWRNTFHFAIGKLLYEPRFRDHRDKIRTLCEDLNINFSDRAREISLGSRVALQILQAGLVKYAPIIGRSLARSALSLLDHPNSASSQFVSELAVVYDPEYESLYKESILNCLTQGSEFNLVKVWFLLFDLIGADIEWARDLALENWPSTVDQQKAILEALMEDIDYRYPQPTPSKFEFELVKPLFWSLSPDEICKYLIRYKLPPDSEFISLSKIIDFEDELEEITPVPLFILNEKGAYDANIEVCSCTSDYLALFDELCNRITGHDIGKGWRFLLCFEQFFKKPTQNNLGKSVIEVCRLDLFEERFFWLDLLPWPVTALLARSKSKSQLNESGFSLVEAGDHSNCYFEGLEAKWKSNGLKMEDINFQISDIEFNLLLSGRVRCFGKSAGQNLLMQKILELFAEFTNEERPTILDDNFSRVLTVEDEFCFDSPEQLSQFAYALNGAWSYSIRSYIYIAPRGSEDWLNALDEIGRAPSFGIDIIHPFRPGDVGRGFLTAFLRDRSRYGLIRLAGIWYQYSRNFLRASADEDSKETFIRVGLSDIINAENQPSAFWLSVILLSQEDLTETESGWICKNLDSLVETSKEENAIRILVSSFTSRSRTAPCFEDLYVKLSQMLRPSSREELLILQGHSYRVLQSEAVELA